MRARRNEVDVEFLPKGLHDLGCKPMRKSLRTQSIATPRIVYEAILLGYGLCGNGSPGLTRATRRWCCRARTTASRS